MWDDLTLPALLRAASAAVATLAADEPGRPVQRAGSQRGEAVPELDRQAVIG